MAQMVEHCTGVAEVWVRIPIQGWIFQAFLAAAEAALKKCDENINLFLSAYQIQILVVSSFKWTLSTTRGFFAEIQK